MSFSCAVIGADGAGKSTICAALPGALSAPAVRIYMGLNPDAGTHMLPTTWLIRRVRRALGRARPAGGPPELRESSSAPSGIGRVRRELRSALWLINQLAEEWYRQGVAWYFQGRGRIVVFDRHYLADYHAHDMQIRDPDAPLARRIHGYLLRHLYPRPDLVVLLDAPLETLYARKPEGSLQALARRHAEYESLGDLFPAMIRVDASQRPERVLQDVVGHLNGYGATHS